MYKFVVIQSGCGQDGYNIGEAEKASNMMAQQGFRLVSTYQTTTSKGCGSPKSSLVLVFEKRI